MKKILYIANARIPTERAHGIQIMEMCEAFARAGAKVDLVIPSRPNPIRDDAFVYYGVDPIFKIKRIPTLNFFLSTKSGALIHTLSFSFTSCFYAIVHKSDIYYSRDKLTALFLSFIKAAVFWEAHEYRNNWLSRATARRVKGLVVITHALKKCYVEAGISSSKIFVAPDGVDIEKFKVRKTKNECRESLALPIGRDIVLYAGHLYEWKGVRVVAEAAKTLSEPLFIFVGGTQEDIERFSGEYKSIENILIKGHRSYSEIPLWLTAADVLVLPNSGKEKVSQYYTSPLKLFEYMSSGTPIIASNLPSIKEVLNEHEAVLIPPDDSRVLAETVKEVLSDKSSFLLKAEAAQKSVEGFSWQKRAQKILQFTT